MRSKIKRKLPLLIVDKSITLFDRERLSCIEEEGEDEEEDERANMHNEEIKQSLNMT